MNATILTRLLTALTLTFGLFTHAQAAPNADRAQAVDPCRSRTVKSTLASVKRNVDGILEAALRPDAEPGAWAAAFQDLIADQTVLVGLCTEPSVLARGCPFCTVDAETPLTVEAAPALLLRWKLGDPLLFDPRLRHRALQD